MKILFLILFLSFAFVAKAQSPIEEGFNIAKPGYEFHFPRDHGTHENFKTEWWYLTGNLVDDNGIEFGYQYTIFRHQLISPNSRTAPDSTFATKNIFLGHFAISNISEQEHRHAERIARPELGQVDVSSTEMNLRLMDWSLTQAPDETISLIATNEKQQFGLNLSLTPNKPLVLNGANGVHVKSSNKDQASYYYSYTNLDSKGTVTWGDKTFTVTGKSWMDHEFGSSWLSENEAGWDWFAIQLDNEVELMLYQLRTRDGSPIDTSEGTLIFPDGTSKSIYQKDRTLRPIESWKSPETGGIYPIAWEIELPEFQAALKITARFPEQEMRTKQSTGSTYWEGAISATGTWEDKPVTGKGYLELVGYTGEMTPLSASSK